ncbi:hypothetical protein B0T17DRAFT_533687 [Bombardia bombarda]|uniref:Uncharacterized protein n=1 Tax=Bombardia bombarda TaxID=252184 RepID=A0AA39WTK0_9PEZI|nr:hypothetical protein B0T17DRAFT_533687 [Bombardia bombarda]
MRPGSYLGGHGYFKLFGLWQVRQSERGRILGCLLSLAKTSGLQHFGRVSKLGSWKR